MIRFICLPFLRRQTGTARALISTHHTNAINSFITKRLLSMVAIDRIAIVKFFDDVCAGPQLARTCLRYPCVRVQSQACPPSTRATARRPKPARDRRRTRHLPRRVALDRRLRVRNRADHRCRQFEQDRLDLAELLFARRPIFQSVLRVDDVVLPDAALVELLLHEGVFRIRAGRHRIAGEWKIAGSALTAGWSRRRGIDS